MSNGNGTASGAQPDLAAPLSRLWRDVYRKAGEVAEARTQELLRYHVYVYPHGAVGGEDTGPWVDEAGDTMTGTLRFLGTDADVGGAVVVTSPASAALDSRVYGDGSAPNWTYQALGGYELGVRFTSAVPAYLVAVRWYRYFEEQPLPVALHLWDTTATTAPVWSVAPPGAWATDTDPGWKEHRLPAGAPPALVAGRPYVLAHHAGADIQAYASEPALVSDPPLAFQAFVRDPTGGAFPATEGPGGLGCDPVVRPTLVFPDPARVGAIRLPNGLAGTIAWRNANNDGDHTLTVDAAGGLVFDGVPLGGAGGTGNTTMHTQTTAPAGATNSLWFNPRESA